MIFNVDARHAISGGRNEEAGVETDFERTGLDVAVPVEVFGAEPEVPFANRGGDIAGGLEDRWNRDGARRDEQARVAGKNLGVGATPGMHSRKEGEARRSARGGGGVGVGKSPA